MNFTLKGWDASWTYSCSSESDRRLWRGFSAIFPLHLKVQPWLSKCTEKFDLSSVSASGADKSCFALFRYTFIIKVVYVCILKWIILLQILAPFLNRSIRSEKNLSNKILKHNILCSEMVLPSPRANFLRRSGNIM